jgi:hypothetical protein
MKYIIKIVLQWLSLLLFVFLLGFVLHILFDVYMVGWSLL